MTDYWLRLFGRGGSDPKDSVKSIALSLTPPKGVDVFYQSPSLDRRYLRSVTVYRLRRQRGVGQFVLEPWWRKPNSSWPRLPREFITWVQRSPMGDTRRCWRDDQTLWQIRSVSNSAACLAAIVRFREGLPPALAQEAADAILRDVCQHVPFLPEIEACELPILRAYMQGQEPAQIAASGAYDEKTVRSCLRRMRARLALPSRADLRGALWAVYARRRKLFFADEVARYVLLSGLALMICLSSASPALAGDEDAPECRSERIARDEGRPEGRDGLRRSQPEASHAESLAFRNSPGFSGAAPRP
ncbi:hypothetical protein [Acidithiobacillus sp.]|uniref:hypothetical protein n=1 Tax=Acidithiobacillus sp. TaxID=1872118 RepID=UPI0025C49C24|nr:hypothetical protein [Acidithiobacillus sp.]